MFKVSVLTPKGNIYTGEVDLVTLPTTQGEIGVMENHENLITSLSTGKIVIKKNNLEEIIVCRGGFVKVQNNTLEVLVDEADMAKDLVLENIKKAEERAQEAIQKTDITTSELIRLEKALRYEKFKRDFVERGE